MDRKRCTFMDILCGDPEKDKDSISKIVIPKIQRDYAQGRRSPEIERVRDRFLDALYNAVQGDSINLDFVYGDVQDGVLTPLDGQQRLTTLFLLHWYAAKKQRLPDEESVFLKKFSYETRYSARDFCAYLVDYQPSFQRKISEDIMNESWFPYEWMRDRTIAGMLVMLDAIDEKFRSVEGLWDRLKEGAVTFYFLPLKTMGLTDEMYIRMNSRGKPLTDFEHFKAELERILNDVDPDRAREIIKKIDLDWTDMLWDYKGENNIIDDEFLRYFKFVCDVISYEDGSSSQSRSYDEFDLLKLYFSGDKERILKNIKTVEDYFDCWCSIPKGEKPAEFLNRFMSEKHESGKIMIDTGRYSIDIFDNCLSRYAETLRSFPLSRFILLYAVITYLLNREKVTETQFSNRLRIVDNLIKNSPDEITDGEKRVSGTRMPMILKQTKDIICEGLIDPDNDQGFNSNQLREEADKQAWLTDHPEDRETICQLEDHELLTGQIAILGLENISMFPRFTELFACDRDKVDCAMMSIGFYGQLENNWRYQIGSGKNANAWRNLFHRSRRKGFEETGRILLELLSASDKLDNAMLEKMAVDYLAGCEREQKFDWRYYYIKYHEFRPERFGKYGNLHQPLSLYNLRVMVTEWKISEWSYNPFMKVADPSHVSTNHNGRRLVYDDCYIEQDYAAYIMRSITDDTEVDRIEIRQDENGIDIENRIEALKKWLDASGNQTGTSV